MCVYVRVQMCVCMWLNAEMSPLEETLNANLKRSLNFSQIQTTPARVACSSLAGVVRVWEL